MYEFWLKIYESVFCANNVVFITFCLSCTCLVAFALLGLKTKSTGIYCALALLVFGVACIATLTQTLQVKNAVYLTASFCVFAGVVYLSLWFALRTQERIRRRKEERRALARKIKFTLPEKENTFVQARLNTALNSEVEKLKEEIVNPVPLAHALSLLATLREKKLSVADGLTCAELGAFLSLYQEKSRWTNEESQAVNSALAGVLKLTAKYSA